MRSSTGVLSVEPGDRLWTPRSLEEATRGLPREGVDLVLIDVAASGLHALETARAVRSSPRSSGVPILFLVGPEASDFSLPDAYALGAVDHLRVPAEPVVLQAKVRFLVDHERQRRAEASSHAESPRVPSEEFLALLAHELRNPLAPLRTGLEVIQPLLATDPTAATTGVIMERQLAHLVRLVDDLLDVARLRQGRVEIQREPVTIQTVLEHATETSRPLVESAGHTLHLDVPGEPLWLRGDLTRLTQVVTNVLHNAVKYTPPGGRIELSAVRQGDDLVVQVTDNGIGIPSEILSSIFEWFTQGHRTTRRSQGGLGVGLSLARQLIELHGGTVEVQSPGVGQGSTFTLRLPLLVDEPQEARSPTPPASEPSSVRRVLVVDDNEDGADLLALTLERQGHEAQVAYDGEQALSLARAFQPEVILLDLGMPGMDGYEVARHLRSEPTFATVRLVALTGWGSEADKQRTSQAGFDEHLTKPVTSVDLERALLRRRSTG